MNKYTYTLRTKIEAHLEDEEVDLPLDTKIADIFSENFDEFSWLSVLISVELTYGFNIPDDLAERTQLTILEFSHQLSKLSVIPAAFYPEFYELKIQMLFDVVREAKIISGLESGTEEELIKIRERLDIIQTRLNQITELPLN